ncbi:immunoglobulin-like domain-containing protein [uncultured Vagococcus sp.]|uniref:immunoglobulin-like domain-containing protein n=1 Tax=uncultured Vagococcus sp. TaxID=189676 RepID=UPI0028D1C3C2|nr:immunoglobulin-like domain-containing protein [uncultured Vagococcus sp.]
MKNKHLIKLTLVTLLAPTFLNAQGAIAAEVPVNAPATEAPKAVVPKTEVPKVEIPKVEVAPTPAPVQPTPAPVPTPVPTPAPEVVPVPEVVPTPEVTPTPETPVNPATPTPEVAPTPVTPAAPGTDTPTPSPGDGVGHIPGENNGGLNAPTLSVNPVKTIKKGSIFNEREGVYAYDNSGDVSKRIKVVKNTVNTAKATPEGGAPYIVMYEVDSVDGGPKTTRTVEVYVVDDTKYGMLTASISDFTIAQNGDVTGEIKKRLVVKGPDGKVLPASKYIIETNGSAGGGDAGKFNISVVVTSTEYHTSTEVTVNVTVLKGLTLKASDRRILVGDTFNPREGVTAFETMANGSTKNLGDYNGTTDSGLSIIGTVNSAIAGVYPITYSAKSASGVVESVTVNITVAESKITITPKANPIVIHQGTKFVAEDYATATDERDGALKVTATHTVDSKTPGDYSITYTATNSANKTETLIVPVIVEKRVPTLIVTPPTIVQDQIITDEMIKSWVKVEDPLEPNLEVSYTLTKRGVLDTSTLGNSFTIDYSVTNSSSNTATASLEVTVAERLPVINATDQTVKIGEIVTDAMIKSWATASDVVDGDNLAVTEYTLLDGDIDTNVPASKYRIEYSYTNTANNKDSKIITVSVADVLMPTLNVENQTMYIGDKLTEEMILAWATTENAENVGFEVIGEAIRVTNPGSNLVEAGTHQIKFTAYSGVNNGKEAKALSTQPFAPKNAEKTITLTVKAKDAGSKNTSHTPAKQNTTKSDTKTKAIKSAKANLPKTGVEETSMMSSLMGLMMVVVYFFFKKKQDGLDTDKLD